MYIDLSRAIDVQLYVAPILKELRKTGREQEGGDSGALSQESFPEVFRKRFLRVSYSFPEILRKLSGSLPKAFRKRFRKLSGSS